MTMQESCLAKGIKHCGYHICVLGTIGAGKCVDGKTIVCADGVFRRIGELADKDGFTEKQMSVLGGNGVEKTSHVFREKSETAVEIKTNHGIVIKCTPEHPLRVLNNLVPEWKRADEIQPSDTILGVGFQYVKAEFDPLYWLKGVFCADGSRIGEYDENGRGRATITTTDKELPIIKNILSRLGFVEDTAFEKFSRMDKNTYRAYADKRKDGTLFEVSFGKITDFTKTKSFYEPMNVNQLLSKIAGFLDTDAYVDEKGIEFLQKREDVIDDILNSLSMFGIVGAKSTKFVKGFSHPFYRVFYARTASKRIATLCLNLVQFVGDKLSRLMCYEYNGKQRNNPDSSTVVKVDKSFLRSECSHYHDKKSRGCMFQASTTGNVSIHLMKKIRDAGRLSFDPDDYTYHSVESVRQIEFNDYVYDVAIPTTHEFIANGLVSHNTSLCRYLQQIIIEHEGRCEGMWEPVEGNPLLPLYYKDKNRYAFPMQIYMLNKRLEQQRLAQDLALSGVSCVQDSSLFGDSCFVEMLAKDGILCPEEVETYSELFANMARDVMYPSLVVYLNCPAEVAKQRVEKRGRDCEKDISVYYLATLKLELDKLVKDFGKYTFVKEIDASIDLDEEGIYNEARMIYDELCLLRQSPIISRMGV